MALTKVTGDFIKAGSITQGHLHSSHGITTSHITEGDKLFFTNARVDSRIGDLSTSNLSEGTNLYYTDTRARAAISVSGNALSYNSSTGVITSNFEESPTFTGNVTITGNINAAKGIFEAANNQISIVDSDDSQDFRVQVNAGVFSVRDHTNTQTIFKISANSGTDALVLNSSGATFSGRITGQNGITVTGGATGADIYINNTSPTLGFTDSNSFTDANDIYIVRGTGGNKLQFQWYDDSAGTTTETFNIDNSGNANFSGDITVSGGDITLGGTGRIQGIDTVSANTDAANKLYVDNQVAGIVDSAPSTLDTLNELAPALGDDANFSTTVTNSIATNSADIVTANSNIATNAADIATNTSNIASNLAAINTKTNEAYVDAQMALNVTASNTYADQAEADAKAYTDTRETAINTAWAAADTALQSAMETYADTAEADAVSAATATASADATAKADAAEVDAKAYTDTRETAITSAYQSYADQAEADAESAAAADATSKADAALVAAKSYADQAEADAESAAAADATSKANAAQSAAISAAATDATTKADAAQAAAISAAASDATTKANAAEAAAISAVTNGAGAAFDTLKEIQDAMATDAELSSAISSVTSSAASTAAADATSKANAAEAAAISTAATDATNKANAALASALAADSDTTYSVGDGGLTQKNFTSTLKSKLDGIAAGATNVTNNNQIANGAGYITSYTDTNTTYSAGNGLSLSGTTFLMSGSYSGSFTATGDITAYSDDSLKTNVQVIDGALGKVEAIRGVTFERIEDGSVSTGVIAQELKEVLPEAVHTDAEGVHSVAYGNITGLLIEAVKELSAQVEELKAK